MKKFTTKLFVGATKPFTIIHMSDTHITYADERDGERKVELSKARTPIFPDAEQMLVESVKLAKEYQAPIMHTGDLMDFVSTANLERVARFMRDCDCFVSAGNHEFSQYVGEAWEDAAYRNQSLAKVQAAFLNDIRMSSRVINGVNFVAIDDSYYLFEKQQLAFLKEEVKKGLPIILMLHNPIYEKQLFDNLIYHREELGLEPRQVPCAYLTGTPDIYMKDYDEHRFRQQKADEITKETVEYIKTQPLIKAALVGHVHCSIEAELCQGVPQIITGCTDLRVIQIF
ncbi:MAG: metallophosphoesterase [Clostridia bacterium]|nr:metallophosphoesterase [Clostridia bacterium]